MRYDVLGAVGLALTVACSSGGSGGAALDGGAGGASGSGGSTSSGGASGSGGSTSSGGASGSGGGVACGGEATHTGEGTYYAADGSGNCSFPATPGDLLVAAMNELDYAGSAVCGACARVTGPQGTVDVRIVDRCPECQSGDLDLAPQAFDRIAEHSAGRVPISWQFVSCSVTGPIQYHYKDGSNPYWTAVQIRNHRSRIAQVEGRASGDSAWISLGRESYNYFLASAGLGNGPYDFRVTDVYGGVVEDHSVPFGGADTDASGAAQLPACP